MIYCLVAYGTNDIKIPCMFWSDGELAKNKCFELLGKPTFPDKIKWSEYDSVLFNLD